MRHRHYEVYGLGILSEIDLALPQRTFSSADVTISRGEELDDVPHASSVASEGPAVVMTIAGVGRYRIIGGNLIEVATTAKTDARELSLFLLGSAFGVLLQQRGVLALHANATSDGRSAVAVAGRSGAGKSTLAAELCDAGMTLLSDDVCAIEMVGDKAVALPGTARLRLWANAIERLGWATAHARKVSPRVDKFEFRASDSAMNAMPLSAIYVLEECDTEIAPGFQRLIGSDAVSALMHNSYRGDLLTVSGGRVRHFDQCIAVARTVPIIKWRRWWGTQHSATNLATFLEHVRGIA